MSEFPREKIASMLGCSLDDPRLDEIKAPVEIYRGKKNADQNIPKRKDRRAELEKYVSALNTIATPSPTVDSVLPPGLSAEICKLAQQSLLFLEPVTNQKSAHGPEPDERKWMLGKLAELFEEITDTKAHITWSDFDSCYTGPFFKFARLVLSTEEFTDDALGKAIQKALRLLQPARNNNR